ncbi:MAG: hypothetical protein GWN71_34905, partial [Gammaproteobacteria bacterium]|nr:hypothetical protein [Gemmatimonadota bacterium]NIT68333.1 hypothetical protein [Gemmatimonadota bacterium]NIU78560.1 hypothetical protein [Gammaproteobacteria bacterium]NIW76885.1 hypothetical protein [Gemmatimonadota bacterium]NIY36910.1 hypothetical protein [Gemmatimonadota bacterium]
MSISLIVTGVGNASTGEEICKSLQLGRQDYDITATNVELDRMVVVDGVRKVLLPPASDTGYLEALAAVADEVEARFILPGSDAELLRIVEGSEELADLTEAVPLANNAEALRICMDKQRTAEVVRQAGMYAPKTFECTGLESALGAMERLDVGYPLIIKPKSGGGGSAHV